MLKTRRALLRTTALIPVVALAACSGMSTSSSSVSGIASQVIQDVSLIATGLSGALPGLLSSGVVTGTVGTNIANIISKITSVASTVTSSLTTVQAQPQIQQLETLVNSLVTTAAGLSLPTPFGPALAAASVLLPVVEAGVGLLVSTATTTAAAAMTPESARLILQAAAKGK